MGFRRRHIPVVHSTSSPLEGTVVSHRSFASGKRELIRLYRNQALPVSVMLSGPKSSEASVLIITNIDCENPLEWHEVPLARGEGSSYSCVLQPRRCGLFQFRVKFSTDSGRSWNWDSTPFSWILVDPPCVEQLRMYTLIPTVSGHLGMWKDELARIRDLGCNAVHLLPLTALDRSESPYAARDLFTIDESFLDPNDSRDGLTQLEDFVTAAERMKMRLCFDLVLNHVGVTSVIAKNAPGWIVPDQTRPDGLKRAGCWTFHEWTAWEDLALLNYEHPSEEVRDHLWTYMIEYALFWGEYANFTGGLVRLDNLHSSDPEFVSTLTRVLRAELPDLGILAEFFANEDLIQKMVPEWQLNLLLAHPWDFKFLPQLRSYLRYLSRLGRNVRFFMPVTSHDSGTPTEEFGVPESTKPRYVISALLGSGQTGLVQGVEYGLPKKVNFIGKHGSIDTDTGVDFGDFILRVNTLLLEHPTFSQMGNLSLLDDNHDAILAAFRRDVSGANRDFLILCNLDIHHEQRIVLDLSTILSAANLRDRLENGRAVSVVGEPHEFVLEPCGVRVYEIERR